MIKVWNDILCKPIQLAMPRLSPWLRPAEGRAWTVHALATSWTWCILVLSLVPSSALIKQIIYGMYVYNCIYIRRPRPTQGGARQGIRHFPPTIWKLATATATATAAAAVLFCAMVFSRPGPTFLQQPAAGAAGRQQQSSQQSRSR